MESTLDKWHTIPDKYLLKFSGIDTVVVCRVCCVCVSYLCIIIIIIIFFICNVGNVYKH